MFMQLLHVAEVETESQWGKIMGRYHGKGQAGPWGSCVEPPEIFPYLRRSVELNGGRTLPLPEWQLTRAWVLPNLWTIVSPLPGPGVTESKCSMTK